MVMGQGNDADNAEKSQRFGAEASMRSGAMKASGNAERAALSTALACVRVANGPSRTR
jgi:hypothetical protein